MSKHEGLSSEFIELVNQFVDDAISAEDFRQLESVLSEDAAAREYFRQYCQLHIDLDTAARLHRVMETIRHQTLGTTAPDQSPIARLPASMVDTGPRTAPTRSSPARRRWVLCALAVVVVAGVGLLYQNRPRTARQPVVVPPAHLNGKDALSTRITFATTETRSIPLGEIGTMHVQGPADLEIFGTTRARLYRGRIRVRITAASGRGFVVETPRAAVTDQGTEFGVDVGSDSDTGVVVFEGKVDLALPEKGNDSFVHVEHLAQGDGVVVKKAGELDRLMSIVTGKVETYQQRGEPLIDNLTPVITDVWDDVQITECRKLYEIVPDGLREDALAYADRPAHEWNGWDERGMPPYLLGADYVKTYNNYKVNATVQISVNLARPARLFIFLDSRVSPPPWLRAHFRETGDSIGVDEPYRYNKDPGFALLGVGPGQSVDARYSIWERVVEQPCVITLGPNAAKSEYTAMYGIAAVALDAPIR